MCVSEVIIISFNKGSHQCVSHAFGTHFKIFGLPNDEASLILFNWLRGDVNRFLLT
jgi:hypothetical protein